MVGQKKEDIYAENPFVVVPLFMLWRWNNRAHLTSSEIRISEFGKNSTEICPKLELLWRNLIYEHHFGFITG